MTDSTKNVQVAAVALIKHDRVCVAKRASTLSSFAGKWEFPGGKVRKEKLSTAAVRELQEEFGVDLCEEELQYIAKVNTYLGESKVADVHLFVSFNWEGEPQPVNTIHDELRWVTTTQLDEIKSVFIPSNVLFFEKVQLFIKSHGDATSVP